MQSFFMIWNTFTPTLTIALFVNENGEDTQNPLFYLELGPMEEDGDWVLVRRPTEKDLWEPSLIQTEPSQPLKVWFNEPAKHWTDAIPIGNGRLGAMVWGGVQLKTLNLNEDTLWTGNPGNYTDPEAPKALAEVRKLVDDGQFAEATTEAVKFRRISHGRWTNWIGRATLYAPNWKVRGSKLAKARIYEFSPFAEGLSLLVDLFTIMGLFLMSVLVVGLCLVDVVVCYVDSHSSSSVHFVIFK